MRTGAGVQYVLYCPHQSSNLLKRTIAKPNIRQSGRDAATDAVNQLNDPSNRGTNDPTVVTEDPFLLPTKEGNRLDPATSNNYEFESIKFEEAMQQIIDKEAEPIEGGGSFQWMMWRFQSKYVHPVDTDLDKVTLQVFEQGFSDKGGGVFNSTPLVTIKKASLVTDARTTLLETDSNIEPETGTNLIAVANKGAGSYPDDYQIFQGAKDAFRLASFWVTARDYKEGHLVENDALTFECIADHTSSGVNEPPNATFWIQRFFIKPALWSGATTYTKDETVSFNRKAYKSLQGGNLNNTPSTSPAFWIEIRFHSPVDYSPLTKDKAQYWINAGGGWLTANVDDELTAVLDPNVVIFDDKHPRTWVDTTQVDSALLDSAVLISGSPFDTLRVLVNGTGLNDFAGLDPKGVSKDNAVLEYRTDPAQGGPAWFVLYSFLQDREVYSKREGESWTYNPCQGALSFVDANGACQIGARSGNWVKGAYVPFVSGGDIFTGEFTANANFDCVHPIKFDTGAGEVELGNEKITNEDGSTASAVFANFAPNADKRAFFAGLNFTMLWPRNANAIPHGAVTIGEQIALKVMDFLNMHQNRDGGRNWFGSKVTDFYPIQGFAFFHLLEDLLPAGIQNLGGDYQMGLFLIDRSDNEIVIDYHHSHNRKTLPAEAPVAKRKVYRGLPGFATVIPPLQPEILEIFDWRNVVWGGIYTKDSFDSNGRYLRPGSSIATLFTQNTRFFNTNKLHIAVDAFRMVKPLVKTNVRDDTKPIRNIEPRKIKVPTIISDSQLQGFVDAKEKVFNFEAEEFPVKTELRCDVAWGDPVYYEDNELVNEADDSLPNTRKTLADKIIYTVSKPAQGPGGHLRTVYLKTRIWP